MRIEELGTGLISGKSAQHQATHCHVRIWLEDAPAVEVAATNFVRRLLGNGPLALELWDMREPVPRQLEQLGLQAEAEGPRGIIGQVAPERLGEVLSSLASRSFGVWIGVSKQQLLELVSYDSNIERLRQMPDRAGFIVFSLYDNNLELYCNGISVDAIRAAAQA